MDSFVSRGQVPGVVFRNVVSFKVQTSPLRDNFRGEISFSEPVWPHFTFNYTFLPNRFKNHSPCSSRVSKGYELFVTISSSVLRISWPERTESSISLALKSGPIIHASRNSAAVEHDGPKASMSRNNGIIKFWLGVWVITVVKLKYLEAESWESSVEWTLGRESRSINLSVYEKKSGHTGRGNSAEWMCSACSRLSSFWPFPANTYKHVA